MDVASEHTVNKSPARDYRRALHGLPDHCALDLAELARRIGADKIELISCARADLDLARLLDSKMAEHDAAAARTRPHNTENT
jgi:hypothetical protein